MKVLLATDGSPCAKDAADFLHGLSFKDGLDLTLLTVTYDPASVSRKNVQPWFPEWRESQQKFVDELHGTLESQFKDSCTSCAREHRHGNIAHQIIETAREIDAELIVIGAVGHSMVGRMLLGSVSDDVATHANCSVVIVRPRDEAASPRHRITLAYDDSAASKGSMEEFSRVQWNQDSQLTVLTIMQEPNYLVAGGLAGQVVQDEVQYLEYLQKACDTAADQLKQVIPNTEAKTMRAHHIGDAILTEAQVNNSDLVVVGDAGHELVDELIVGSTAKYVLRHADCGVWISRHHRQ